MPISIDIHFWGTRGSYFKSGPDCSEFGGHTSCISLHHKDDIYIIDGGSGLSNLGSYLLKNNRPSCAHIFLSHLHLDHICGIPSFIPVWWPDFEGHLYCGIAQEFGGLAKTLSTLYTPPYFPIPWSNFPFRKHYHDFTIGSTLHPTPHCRVETILLNHPGHGSGFAFHINNRKIVYLCDTNHTGGFFDRFIPFAHRADLLIYDASYTSEKWDKVENFGHSTWEKACELAQKASVETLALTHHDYQSSDRELLSLEKSAQTFFPQSFAARCGQHFILK